MAPRCLPALEVTAAPRDFGRRARHFINGYDDNFGEFKRAWFEVDSVACYLQCYREADDGTLTVFADLAACLRRARSPNTVALRLLSGLGMEAASITFVHTAAEQAFWLGVDPHAVARVLSA